LISWPACTQLHLSPSKSWLFSVTILLSQVFLFCGTIHYILAFLLNLMKRIDQISIFEDSALSLAFLRLSVDLKLKA